MGRFCENAKKEMLCAPIHSRKAKTAFLSAIFSGVGSLHFAGGQKRFVLRLSSAQFKETVKKLLSELYKDGADFTEDERNRITVAGAYFETLATGLKLFKKETDGGLSYIQGIPSELITDPAARIAYLRGLFIGAGSVTITKGYHLEFSFFNGFLARDCASLLRSAGFKFSEVLHKDKTVVYIKDNEAVSDCLAYLGAGGAVLELCDVYAKRSTDKATNRRINCDLANIDKTVALAAAQTERIIALKQSGKLKQLPQKLQETAALRLKYPEASLADLAALAGITKSGMRHRLDKLVNHD